MNGKNFTDGPSASPQRGYESGFTNNPNNPDCKVSVTLYQFLCQTDLDSSDPIILHSSVGENCSNKINCAIDHFVTSNVDEALVLDSDECELPIVVFNRDMPASTALELIANFDQCDSNELSSTRLRPPRAAKKSKEDKDPGLNLKRRKLEVADAKISVTVSSVDGPFESGGNKGKVKTAKKSKVSRYFVKEKRTTRSSVAKKTQEYEFNFGDEELDLLWNSSLKRSSKNLWSKDFEKSEQETICFPSILKRSAEAEISAEQVEEDKENVQN